MDFSFTEEQTLLEESVAKYIQNDYDFESRQQMVKSEDGFSRDNWATFAELGWLGVPFTEEDGGQHDHDRGIREEHERGERSRDPLQRGEVGRRVHGI